MDDYGKTDDGRMAGQRPKHVDNVFWADGILDRYCHVMTTATTVNAISPVVITFKAPYAIESTLA